MKNNIKTILLFSLISLSFNLCFPMKQTIEIKEKNHHPTQKYRKRSFSFDSKKETWRSLDKKIELKNLEIQKLKLTNQLETKKIQELKFKNQLKVHNILQGLCTDKTNLSGGLTAELGNNAKKAVGAFGLTLLTFPEQIRKALTEIFANATKDFTKAVTKGNQELQKTIEKTKEEVHKTGTSASSGIKSIFKYICVGSFFTISGILTVKQLLNKI
ncbi:hypothetical protein KAH94_01620 [bacterium]|nr:hypothetical protein [bacterium]